MSLRLRRANIPLADDTSVFEDLKPYIEKLLLSPQGIGLIAVGVGVLLRFTHRPPLIGPLQGDDQSLAAHMKGRYGLDQVVFHIPMKAVENYVQTFAQGAISPIMGVLGIFGWHLNQKAVDEATGEVDVLLSDLLIIMGVGVFLGSSVQSVLSAIPKV